MKTVDARGLLCPLPVIRTQDSIKNLTPGTILTVLTTDPGSLEDIPAWCRVHGHTVIKTRHVHDDIHLMIRVS
ncbi:sulfurtransferase TusA family protein [Gammaproteobacteria bacterium]|nr:sulfurtransferase TusA family protein [Gammaproteobacteria bacterium]